jgi:hypothetical protein
MALLEYDARNARLGLPMRLEPARWTITQKERRLRFSKILGFEPAR